MAITAGKSAGYDPSANKPWPMTCACNPAHPGWFDAGCVFHGIVSMMGMWDGEVAAIQMRDALLPGKRMNVKWD